MHRNTSETPLTHHQYSYLRFISAYTRDKGFPPSVREIAREFGGVSPQAVVHSLNSLKRKGCIVSAERTARSIRITDHGYLRLGTSNDESSEHLEQLLADVRDAEEGKPLTTAIVALQTYALSAIAADDIEHERSVIMSRRVMQALEERGL